MLASCTRSGAWRGGIVPYATNPEDDVRVYYEVEGSGPAIILYAGFINAIRNWRDLGYVDGLRDDYTLVLVDPRGHGKSDAPDDPKQYVITKMAADVQVVLDELGIDRAHLLGFSMGARAGYWLAHLAPERLITLMTIGGPVHPPTGHISPMIDAFERGPAATADAWAATTATMPDAVREQILENDTRPFIRMVQARREEASVEEHLPTLEMPVLVYAGQDDVVYEEAKLTGQLIPQSTFVSIPDLDHNQSFYRSDLALPYIREFLAEFG
ncbi:alpha/beta hydrolase [soil metagenome]